MFFSRRKRRRQREEIAAHLTDVRDAAESSVRELSLCQAVLEIQAEQLEAAELTGDETSAREIMQEMQPLLAERDRLIARENARNEILAKCVTEIEVTKWV